MTEPIRIFVGCAANNEDLESQVVLEHTLRKYASQPLEITWMQLSKDPASPFYCDPSARKGWRTEHWATPFSGFRWAIPLLCGCAGRAIYMDSDFIFRADIAELYNLPMANGRSIIAANSARLDCSLWDCSRFKSAPLEWLQRSESSIKVVATYIKANTVQSFPQDSNWNVLDIAMPVNLNQPSIKAIHYTQMHTQPQLKYAIPRLKQEGGRHWYERGIKPHPRADLQALFDQEYEEAQHHLSIDNYRREPFGHYKIRGLK